MFTVPLFIEDGGNSNTIVIQTPVIPSAGDAIEYDDDKVAVVQFVWYKLTEGSLVGATLIPSKIIAHKT